MEHLERLQPFVVKDGGITPASLTNTARQPRHDKLGERGKKQTRRVKVIQEIRDSERTYVQQLQALEELYHQPVRESLQSGAGLMTHRHAQELFSNSTQIYEMNCKFLAELEHALTEAGPDACKLGPIFLQYLPFFKTYKGYAANHDVAIKRLEQLLSKNKPFRKLHDANQNKEESKGLSLASLLIVPIQRIPRYKLLIQELLKCSGEDAAEQTEGLEEALRQVSAVATDINDAIESMRNREMILSLQESFGNVMQLITPSRKYIMQGALTKVGRKSGDTRFTFFLFNDLLLYAERGKSRFRLHRALPIDDTFAVEELSANNLHGVPERHREKAWLLQSKVKSFAVFADTVQEKQVWLTALREQLDKFHGSGLVKRPSGLEPKPILQRTDLEQGAKACPICKKAFSNRFRKQHCQRCGTLVCGDCSKGRAALSKAPQKKERVCWRCEVELTAAGATVTRESPLPLPVFSGAGAGAAAKLTLLNGARGAGHANSSSSSSSSAASSANNSVRSLLPARDATPPRLLPTSPFSLQPKERAAIANASPPAAATTTEQTQHEDDNKAGKRHRPFPTFVSGGSMRSLSFNLYSSSAASSTPSPLSTPIGTDVEDILLTIKEGGLPAPMQFAVQALAQSGKKKTRGGQLATRAGGAGQKTLESRQHPFQTVLISDPSPLDPTHMVFSFTEPNASPIIVWFGAAEDQEKFSQIFTYLVVMKREGLGYLRPAQTEAAATNKDQDQITRFFLSPKDKADLLAHPLHADFFPSLAVPLPAPPPRPALPPFLPGATHIWLNTVTGQQVGGAARVVIHHPLQPSDPAHPAGPAKTAPGGAPGGARSRGLDTSFHMLSEQLSGGVHGCQGQSEPDGILCRLKVDCIPICRALVLRFFISSYGPLGCNNVSSIFLRCNLALLVEVAPNPSLTHVKPRSSRRDRGRNLLDFVNYSNERL
eukprot:g11554.t1